MPKKFKVYLIMVMCDLELTGELSKYELMRLRWKRPLLSEGDSVEVSKLDLKITGKNYSPTNNYELELECGPKYPEEFIRLWKDSPEKLIRKLEAEGWRTEY